MGNCVNSKHGSWTDEEEWEWSSSPEYSERLLRGGEARAAEKVAAPTEIKIKITKKQLEELLQKVDGQGLSIQQLIAQLVAVRESRLLDGGLRHWRPALKSIPESPES